jgi:hypothetical protein
MFAILTLQEAVCTRSKWLLSGNSVITVKVLVRFPPIVEQEQTKSARLFSDIRKF